MTRTLTAFLVIVVVSTAAVWAHTDPAAITPFAAPKAPAEADTTDAIDPPPAAVVARVFKASCGRCHGSDRPAVALSLRPENFADAMIDVPSKEIEELKLVDTKAPEKSYLLMKIRGDEGIIGERMPLGSKALGEPAIAAVETWTETVSAAAADTAAGAEPESPEALEGQERPRTQAAQEATNDGGQSAKEAE